MDRITHQRFSSCCQMPNRLPSPVARQMRSIFSLSSIKCCFRMEKDSRSSEWKIYSSSPSWSYFEVYGDAQGYMSTADSKVCKSPCEQTIHRGGSSRVLAAWKKIQSWSSAKAISEAKIRDISIPTQDGVAREDQLFDQSDALYHLKGSWNLKASQYVSSQAGGYVGQSREFRLSRALSQPLIKKTNTKRELAVAAVTQALTPYLLSHRDSHGELGLCMENFLESFMSSAQTNETRFREDRVRRNLESMLKKTEAAEREVKAIQSWIDDAENRLYSMPSERDIEFLEDLLDNLLCHSEEGLVQDKRDQFLRAASNLKYFLSNMHTVAEIQDLKQELKEIDKELSRCDDSCKEAVNLLRSAIARGEFAWLRNLESVAACLEAKARTVLPFENSYTTNS